MLEDIPEVSFFLTITSLKCSFHGVAKALIQMSFFLKYISRVLFASSVLNLAELTALRPDLAGLHKVIYFHENQLQYPVRKQQERDFQYGYNQIMSW